MAEGERRAVDDRGSLQKTTLSPSSLGIKYSNSSHIQETNYN